MLDAIARIRKATANRPQGPARVSPNHVFVGEAAASAINFYGEPRLQGGPGSSVRQATLPAALPLRRSQPGDGHGVRIAVLDTGMFDHEWLKSVQRAPNSADVWDVEHDGYGDAEAGHGTFIAGLILQVAPAASVYAVKVLDSHGVGDDRASRPRWSNCRRHRHRQPFPRRLHRPRRRPAGDRDRDAGHGPERRAVVAAAGNQGASRPFWPAAFDQVLAVGAVEQATASGRVRTTATTARGSTPSPADRTCSPRSRARRRRSRRA